MQTQSPHELLSDAIELRDQFDRRESDRRIEDSGGIVLYAMDNDVMTSITAPWQVEGRVYLDYFLSSDEEAQISLAYILAEYFLRAHEMRAPFVLLHPTDLELERLWNRVYTKAEEESGLFDDAIAVVSKHLEKPAGIPAEEQKFLTFLRGLIAILSKRHGAIAELERVVRVRGAHTVIPADCIVYGGEPVIPEVQDKDFTALEPLCNKWLTELNKERKPAYSNGRTSHDLARPRLDPDVRWTNNQIDAAVLARVEWINHSYEAEAKLEAEKDIGARKAAKRLCFVTGDQAIGKIAAERKWKPDSVDQKNVAQAFVRNPMCFLADAEFFRLANVKAPDFFSNLASKIPILHKGVTGSRVDATSLSDWLNVLFPATLPRAARTVAKTEIAEKFVEATEKWSTYLKVTAAGARFREADSEFKQRIDRMLSSNDLLEGLKKLGEQAARAGNNAVTRFGIAGVLAGFWSLDSKRSLNRAVPAVKFESFGVAREAIQALLNADTFGEAQQILNRGRATEIEGEEPSQYSLFVVFALAFAIANEFRHAKAMARAAFSLAANHDQKNGDPKSKTVKGDEAAYLCAVFGRLCANEPRELNACETLLAAAEERQRWEPVRESLRQNPDYRDVRFRAERLHVKIAERHFREFRGSDQVMRDQFVAAESLQGLCVQHLDLLGDLSGEKDVVVRAAVEMQVATNFLQLQFLALRGGDESAIMPAEAANAVERLAGISRTRGKNTNTPDDLHLPTHVKFVFLSASAVFHPGGAGWDRDSMRKALLEETVKARKELARLKVMPYEISRGEAVMFLVRDALKKLRRE
jgi:hypothetical protein